MQNCIDRQDQDIFLQDVTPLQFLPEKQEQNTYFLQEFVVIQSDFDHPTKLKNLVSESWNAALLDSGATSTVTGEKWLQSCIESLSEEEKSEISLRKSSNAYRFGDGKLVSAMKNCDIPAVVSSDMPLLLSQLSMKRANMTN